MKKLILLLPIFVAMACSTPVEEKVVEKNVNELIVEKNNEFTEYYPGKKQVKMHGFTDENGKRHGAWEYYSQEGVKLSATMFEHGLKEGFSVAYYPSGVQHYIGEYKNDQKVGEWRVYDEKGTLIESKTF